MPPRASGRGRGRGRGTGAPAAAEPVLSDDDDDDDVEEEEDDGAPACLIRTCQQPCPCGVPHVPLAVSDLSSLWVAPLAVEVDQHPIGIILKSLKQVKDVRFEVSNEHWRGEAAYSTLPPRVIGVIEKWTGTGKSAGKIHVNWKTDSTNSDEFLAVLLRPPLSLKLLPYEDGRTAPTAHGAPAKRKYATAMHSGPYAPPAQEDAGLGSKVQVALARVARSHPTHMPCFSHSW